MSIEKLLCVIIACEEVNGVFLAELYFKKRNRLNAIHVFTAKSCFNIPIHDMYFISTGVPSFQTVSEVDGT